MPAASHGGEAPLLHADQVTEKFASQKEQAENLAKTAQTLSLEAEPKISAE
jgi:hypothetical protein